jgi:peroxiredoxin
MAREATPALERVGAKWIVVSIGTLERSRDFSRENNIPVEIVYGDETNATYDALMFRRGVKQTFGEKATPESIAKRIQKDGAKTLLGVLKRWKPWLPPKQEQGFQQGGTIVFKGEQAVYKWYDVSTGAHAPVEDVLKAAGAVTMA